MGVADDPVASGAFKLLTRCCPEQVWQTLVCPDRGARVFPGLSLVSTWATGDPLEIHLPTQSVLRGQVLLAERPAQLTFSIEDASGTTTYVSWRLRRLDQGCVVTLEVHDAGADRGEPDELEDAWLPILERLREVLMHPEVS